MTIVYEAEAFKLYRYVPDYKKRDPNIEGIVPCDVDFSTGLIRRLPRKSTIFRGERTITQYYDSYDEQTETFNDLILEVRHTFNRGGYTDDTRLATSRDTEIHWQLEDNTFSSQFKTLIKYYSNLQRMLEEVQTRRHNAANELADMVVAAFGPVATSTTTQNILGWSTTNRGLIDAWIEYGAYTDLVAEIPPDTDPDWGQDLLNGETATDQFTDFFTNI